MGKKNKKRKAEGQQEAPSQDSAQAELRIEEGGTYQARNAKYNHVYDVTVRDGICVCPHCIRQVPKGNVIDPYRQARLKKREKDLADREQSHFAQMVQMYNTNLRLQGKPELSPDQVEAVKDTLIKLFKVSEGS